MTLRPNACPRRFPDGCYIVSLRYGANIVWCYGPPSNPCADTNQYGWGGVITTAKGNPTTKMSASWYGPYQCVPSLCGSDQGTYVLDTISVGKGLRETSRFKYVESVCKDASCVASAIGLLVGP